MILALFSPLADPARLSVADQVARLERGAVLPRPVRFRASCAAHSGQVGLAALDRLTRSDNAEIARLATAARAQVDRYAVDLLEEADTPFTSSGLARRPALAFRFPGFRPYD